MDYFKIVMLNLLGFRLEIKVDINDHDYIKIRKTEKLKSQYTVVHKDDKGSFYFNPSCFKSIFKMKKYDENKGNKIESIKITGWL